MPVYSTDVYTCIGGGGGGGVRTRGGPQRPPVNPLGVDLLRDAKLYRRIVCIVKLSNAVELFEVFLFLFCVAEYLLFQSSRRSSLTGVWRYFQFIFIFLSWGSGEGGWGSGGVSGVSVLFTIDLFFI